MQAALLSITGQTRKIGFRVQPGQAIRTVTGSARFADGRSLAAHAATSEHPLVSKLCELLQGEVVRVDPPAEQTADGPHQPKPNRQPVFRRRLLKKLFLSVNNPR